MWRIRQQVVTAQLPLRSTWPKTTECDVAFCANVRLEIPEDSVEPDYIEKNIGKRREGTLRLYMLVHEFGHCLGLGHAGDLSS